MSYKVRQKDLRAMLAYGIARPLIEAENMVKDGVRRYGDFEKVSYSTGVYGINGVCVEDRVTGQLYATAARNTLCFTFA